MLPEKGEERSTISTASRKWQAGKTKTEKGNEMREVPSEREVETKLIEKNIPGGKKNLRRSNWSRKKKGHRRRKGSGGRSSENQDEGGSMRNQS